MTDLDNRWDDPASDPDDAVSAAELTVIRAVLRDVEPIDALSRRRMIRAALDADAVVEPGAAVEGAAPPDIDGVAAPIPLERHHRSRYQRTAWIGAAAAAVLVSLLVATSGDDRDGDNVASDVPTEQEASEGAAAGGLTTAAGASDTTSPAGATELAVEASSAAPAAAEQAASADTATTGAADTAGPADTTADRFDTTTAAFDTSTPTFERSVTDLGDLGSFDDAGRLSAELVDDLDRPPTSATSTSTSAVLTSSPGTTAATASGESAPSEGCPAPDGTSAVARAVLEGAPVVVFVVGGGSERTIVGFDAQTCQPAFRRPSPAR